MVNEFIKDYNIILTGIKNSEQTKGCNFIGAPDGSVVYINDIEPEITNYFSQFTNKKIIELKCSFTPLKI